MIHHHKVTKEEVNIRLDKLFATLEPTYARNQIQQWIKKGYVLINDQQEKANYKCRLEDIVTWSIPEEKPIIIVPEAIPLDIVYEDEYVAIINKPKGMLIHPTEQEQTNTLVNALLYRYNTLSTLSGKERLGIVHRLDKDTSGIVVIAKDNATHAHLQKQFQAQTVTRIYEAIVEKIIDNDEGIIQAPIGRHPTQRYKRTVLSDGREAETHFKVLERFQKHTHVQCELITGRTHQIRVHFNYMNHPLVGDPLYNDNPKQIAQEQALFARELHIIHPYTNELMIFKVQQPTYFTKLLKKVATMS